MMSKCEYISIERMENIININDVTVDSVYRFFLNQDIDVIYVNHNNYLYGVISFWDFERYLMGNNEEITINRHYISVNSFDEKIVERELCKFEKIHEIPVVLGNKLVGIFCVNKSSSNSEINREKKLQHLLWDKRNRAEWYVNETKRFIKLCPAKVYLYAMPNMKYVESACGTNIKNILAAKREYPTSMKGLLSMSKQEKTDFWGTSDYKSIETKFVDNYSDLRICQRDGVYKIGDIDNDFFCFKNGYRVIDNVPDRTSKKIFMFGPCLICGAYVMNNQTISYYFQQYLNDADISSYEVVNCGLLGPEDCMNRAFIEEIGSDDIVVVFDFWGKYLDRQENVLHDYYASDLSSIFVDNPMLVNYVFNDLSHCNYLVNRVIAKKLFDDLVHSLSNNVENQIRSRKQDFYIPWKVHSYFKKYFEQYSFPNMSQGDVNGAIVMNCNPFTRGHLYLIEQASKLVDNLYIFVVQEDKSYFSFEDRYNMVRLGVREINNVYVFPSGEYILSKDTFSQYFEKDAVKSVDNMDYDLHLFALFVAKRLNIKVRFVGEELSDHVTKVYNESMKRVLIKYSIDVCEIKRIRSNQGVVISASIVRRMIKDGIDNSMIRQYIPDSTYEYLRKKYNNLK